MENVKCNEVAGAMYPVDRYERNQLHYPLDRDLSSG